MSGRLQRTDFQNRTAGACLSALAPEKNVTSRTPTFLTGGCRGRRPRREGKAGERAVRSQPRRPTPGQAPCPGAHGETAPRPTPKSPLPGLACSDPWPTFYGVVSLPFLWVVWMEMSFRHMHTNISSQFGPWRLVTGEAARPGPANTSGPSALPWGRVNSRAPRRGSRHCSGGPRPGSRFLRVLPETRLPGEPAFEASPRRRQTRQERFLPPRRLSVHDARTGVLLRDPPKPVTQQGLCRQEARKASSREINPLPASAKHPGARPRLCPPGPGEPRPHPEKPRSDWGREDDAAVKALASDSDLPPRHRGLIPSPLRASAPASVNWGHNGFRPTASFSG